MPPTALRAERIDYMIMESYSIVSVSRESNRLKKSNSYLDSVNALIQRLSA